MEEQLMYDYLIVGAGLYGAVFAREATEAGKKVLVVDKRPNIAGNVYTEDVEGIKVHVYGAHIFHTNNREVWDYVNRFAAFNRFTNSPVANYKGELYSLPFNMYTFNRMWGVVTPEEAAAFSKSARENGFGVIIAAAGMAAHLAGAIAANTTLPVIGIPCSSKVLEGMDALLSTVMMPPGIPVATVGVNTAKNAALLAIEILAVTDEELQKKLQADRDANRAKIVEKNKAIEAQFNS